MFHTKYTITLNHMSLMLELNDASMLCRIPNIPARMARRRFAKFMAQYEADFAGSDNLRFRQEIARTMAWHKIKNILPLLYTGLLYNPSEYNQSIFEHYFGYIPEVGDAVPLMRITDEIDRLSKRFKEMYNREAPEQQKSVSFEDIVLSVETILDRPIDRSLKLFQFKKYYDLSLQRLKDQKYGS